MNTLNSQVIGYLCIGWFLSGMMMGHSWAKYARRKKETRIIGPALALAMIAATYLALWG